MNEKEKKYICGRCKLSFNNRQAKSRHINTTCGKSKKIFVCETCGKESSRKDNHERHLKICTVKKTQKKQLKCSICFKEFDKNSSLQRHIKTHWKREHLCQICNKKYIRIDHFIAHKKICNQNHQSHSLEVEDLVEDLEIENVEVGFDQSYSLEDLSMAFSVAFEVLIAVL